jgi:uncharacterized protein YPO0396
MSETLELEFMSDDRLAGFRLQRLEVFNWGTFTDKVWALELDGRNCLLTGDIGSGKSTLVDALTTLLIPSRNIIYNQAAGASRNERSLASYVLGQYKSERQDSQDGTKPVYLRDQASYSVLLAVFHNQGYQQTVTLAQVFWMKDRQTQPARFYVAADGDLSIARDFSDFGSNINALRRRLRLKSVELFDAYTPYGAWFRRRFGINNDQAMELFYQAVSLKSVGNLTDFVRAHMLRPMDLEKIRGELIRHFEDLNAAHNAILKAKRQLAALTPLMADCALHGELTRQLEELRACRDALRPWFNTYLAELLRARIANLEQELANAAAVIAQGEEQRRTQQRHEGELIRAIAENGGDRLERIAADIASCAKERKRRRGKARRYEELLAALGATGAARTLEDFQRQRADIDNWKQHDESERQRLQDQLIDARADMKQQLDEYERLCQEITSLKTHGSNIGEKHIALRGRLCSVLGIAEQELPFVGELLRVRETERDWAGPIERLLHDFGLSLLVPDCHYQQLLEWVDSNSLRGQLLYYRVRDNARSLATTAPAANSVLHKLEIKPESPFYAWLDRELNRRYHVLCCQDLEQFRRESQALSPNGHFKLNGEYHAKDDSFPLGDPRYAVLGWSNAEKIAALEREAHERKDTLDSQEKTVAELNTALEQIQLRMDKLAALREFTDFQEIDWRQPTQEIARLEAERQQLEATSDILKLLRQQLDELRDALRKTETQLDKDKEKQAVADDKLANARERLAAVEEQLATQPEDVKQHFTTLAKLRAETLGEKSITVDNCEAREREMRDEIQGRLDNGDRRIGRLRDKITTSMGSFNHDWPLETRDMDANVAAAAEYQAMHDRLQADDLPRFEQRFKELLNENIIREIVHFQSQLNRESDIIEERIAHINESLTQIDYNPGRYIRLQRIKSNDREISDFQKQLRTCTEGTLTGSDDTQYSEAKFLQVKSIIERFRGRESFSESDRRWTAKVTDVRNWFEFAASERWREDDREFEHYADSGGKSGGQKEKLAYTVLAASLAYQFGLEWGAVRSRSFRFVVIDEAFGRGSDESAQYGLQLFSRLNLQVLVVTPLQKIHIIEPFVAALGFVQNNDGRSSLLRNLSIEQYRRTKHEVQA